MLHKGENPKLSHEFNPISVRLPTGFFVPEKLILKFIWKKRVKESSWGNSKKEERWERHSCYTDFKILYKATVIKKKKQLGTNPWTDRQINANKPTYVKECNIYEKGGFGPSGQETTHSTNRVGTSGQAARKKGKVNLYLTPDTDVNSKWSNTYNWKKKAIKRQQTMVDFFLGK